MLINYCQPFSAYIPEECSTEINKSEEAMEDSYEVVNKRKSQVSEKEEAPPIPAHTVKELYAAVNKTPKFNDSAAEEVQLTNTIQSLCTPVKKARIGDHQEDKDCKQNV